MKPLEFLFGRMQPHETPAEFAWRCAMSGAAALVLTLGALALFALAYVIL